MQWGIHHGGIEARRSIKGLHGLHGEHEMFDGFLIPVYCRQ